ncbi:uncharacterized protein V1513DRAFT_439197 [Lipomyces chichibuensis]|uniref:uncharacterized protein n=1 Tax=Lipomyces chichibuensis TaxID=1546026 RepID=UPI0033439B25
METRMLSASTSASQQETGKLTPTLPNLASSERPTSPIAISSTASPSTPLSSSLTSSHFHQDVGIQGTTSLFSIYSPPSPSPSSQPPSSAFSGVGTPLGSSTSSSTAALASKPHRSLSLSMNTTKPLRCTSLHHSMVPPSPDAAVVMSPPLSRRNSLASTRVGFGSGSDGSSVSSTSMGQAGYNNHTFHGISRNSSPATLQQREGSSSLSTLGLVSSAVSTPSGSHGMGVSSEDEEDDYLEDVAADTDISRNFDNGDRTGQIFGIDRALLRHQSISISSRNESSDSSSISSPNTPNLFPPSSSSSSQFNSITTSTGASNTATSSYFPGFVSTDDEMPSAGQATESRHNSMTSRLRESLTFGISSSSVPTTTQPVTVPNLPIEEMPRRAVVFSRLGGGSLKPQTRSFMRITRELADEFAPADAEIKHEAEITMAFRDESLGDGEDDYEDDEDYEEDTDFASMSRRTDKRQQKFSSKFKYGYPGEPSQDAIFPTDTTSSPSSSGKLLESPPFQRRKRAASATSVGYCSDRRADDEDDTNDTDDGRRDDTGVGMLSAGASPVTGAVFMQAIKRPNDGWESPLSTSPVGSTGKLKRRGTMDERFEPYSIKRRAVSPGMVTASSPTMGSPGTFAAGKRSMKQMQDTYDRIQKMSLN